jgi:ribosomal protein S21
MSSRKRQKTADDEEEKPVQWRKCPGREILLEDLEPDGILEDHRHRPAKDLWRFYKTLPEFAGVPFSQFKHQLEIYLARSGADKEMAERDERALRHDRAIHPRRSRNRRGELVFDMHIAKDLLRRDIENGRHLEMKPSDLRRTQEAYMQFTKTVFRHRIYQEVRRRKFFHYLDLKRAKQRPAPPRSKQDLMTELMFQDLNIRDTMMYHDA